MTQSATLWVLGKLLKVVLALGMWAGLVYLMVQFLVEHRATHAIFDAVPDDFPILVVTEEKSAALGAQVVYWGDLEEFRARHPRHAFLVPPDRVAELSAKAKSRTRLDGKLPGRLDGRDIPYTAEFLVRENAPGRQRLEVQGNWDKNRVKIGRYEATDKDIHPLEYVSYDQRGIAGWPVLLSFFAVYLTFKGWDRLLRAVRRR